MASRIDHLPESFGAFAHGLLSLDQMAVVARRTPAHNDHEVCQLAQAATVAQLRAVLNKRFLAVPQPTTDEDEEPRQDHPAAAQSSESVHHARLGSDDDGSFFLHALADSTDGAVIDAALREARDALFRSGNTDATWLEALVEVCGRSIGAVSSPSRRDLFRVLIHVDTESAWVHKGPALPPTVMDLVLCDGVVQPVWTTGGLPVNVGRRRRIVPAHTRLLVEDRDRMCRNPLCSSKQGLEVHHIVHWHGDERGPTDTKNLCCLCRRCHRAHHRGEFTITGDADISDGLAFTHANGRPMAPCGTPRPPGTDPPPAPRLPYRHPTGERLDARWLWFRPPPGAEPSEN